MWMEPVARREPSRDAHTAAGPEDGAGFAADGGNAGRGPPGLDWSMAGKKAREWGKKYSFPVFESGEAPQGEGV